MLVRTILAAVAVFLCAGPVHAQTPVPAGTDLVIPAGRLTLNGRLFAPLGRARFPVVVLVAGAGNESELDAPYTRLLARAFTDAGMGVLAYDKRGVGGSTGTYTGADFDGLGADAAAVARFAQRLPQAEAVGFWGISQAGWVIPRALRGVRNVRFAIIVSPPGVSAYEQIAYFLRGQITALALTPDEVAAADHMHRAVTLYYSGRESYAAAQAVVDANRNARWFHDVVTHPYWDDMTPDGRILDPQQLAQAIRDRPGAFEFRDPNYYVDHTRRYRVLRRLPTLIIYGSADELGPVTQSRALFEQVLRGEMRHDHEIRVFDGASHDITDADGRLAPGYLAAMTEWAASNF